VNTPPTLAQLREQPHWSVSALQLFLGCPLKWACQHRLDAEPEFTPHALLFGRWFHSAVVKAVTEPGTNAAKTAQAFFSTYWGTACDYSEPAVDLTKDEIADLDQTGQRMLQVLVDNLDPADRIVCLSQPFCVPLIDPETGPLKKPLVGEFDAIAERDSLNFLLDWKSSAARWPAKKADGELQGTGYIYAYQRLTGLYVPLRFDVVTKAKQPKLDRHLTTRKPGDGQRLVALAQVADRMIEQELFYPCQSFLCESCPYRRPVCQDWHWGYSTPAPAALAIQPKGICHAV
jgi:hypothetical protein